MANKGELPPHSAQAEEAVLGSVLKNPTSLYRVAEFVRPTDFYDHRHQAIWAAMQTLASRQVPVDYHTLADQLQQEATYNKVGGLQYLAQVNISTPTSSHIDYYADIVVRLSMQRQLIAAAQETATGAWLDKDDPLAIVAAFEKRITNIRKRQLEGEDSPNPKVAAARFLERYRLAKENAKGQDENVPRLVGLSTGNPDLDKLLLGWRRKTYNLLGARTGKGKSVLMVQWAVHIAARYGPVAFFSTEMSEAELMDRAAAMLAKVNRDDVLMGTTSDAQDQAVVGAAGKLEAMPLYWRTDAMTASGIRLACLRLQEELNQPLAAIFVDYVQQLEGQPSGFGKRNEDLGRESLALRRLAKEFDVPLIAAAQLNRQLDGRSNPIPRLSDFRDSGNLEQDAHVVLTLVVPDPNDADEDSKDQYPRLFKLKDRNRSTKRGEGNSVRLQWVPDGEYYGAADTWHGPGKVYTPNHPSQVVTRGLHVVVDNTRPPATMPPGDTEDIPF